MVYKNPKYFQIICVLEMDSITVPGLNSKKFLFYWNFCHWVAIAVLILTLSTSFLDIFVFPKEPVSPDLIKSLLLSILWAHNIKLQAKNSLLSCRGQPFLPTSLKGTSVASAQG